MRILVYTLNYAPELTGIGKYTTEMVEWLVEHGHTVRVVTALPYYPQWKIHDEYRGKSYVRDRHSGIRVWRAPIYVPSRPNGIKRVIHLASFAALSLPLLLRHITWRPNVVWVVEPPIFATPLALVLAKLSRARSWLHIQDFEIQAGFSLGLLRSQMLKKVILGGERWLIRRFSKVSTISSTMADRVASVGIPRSDVPVFPNWVDVNEIQPLTRPSSFRAKLGIPESAVVALYSGNMGAKQGMETLAELATILQTSAPDVRLVFVGDGACRPELEEHCKDMANVTLLPLQPAEEMNELLGLADIHLLPQKPSVSGLLLPSKLGGILASGRPVVATADADTELALLASQGGLVVTPGDAAAFASAVIQLARDPERRRKLGVAGRRYAEFNLSREYVLRAFEAALVAISDRGSRPPRTVERVPQTRTAAEADVD